MIESGFPDFVVGPFNGILGPAGLPKEIVSKLNQALNEFLRRPEVQHRLADVGLYAIVDTPEGFRHQIEQETARWREVIKRANIPQSE
jgi:tripartite-type tricarboxylate transporter receptor subunit TctC